MNPSTNENPGLNLPPPVGERLPAIPGLPEAPKLTQNMSPATAETKPGMMQPSVPMMSVSAPTVADNQAVPTTNSVASNTTTNVVPSTADDGDLIEKEWVNKAKQIVERNREDPHNQSAELTVFKADYMKQRYNKSIKISEQ